LQSSFRRFSFPRFRFFFPTHTCRVFTHSAPKLFGLPRRNLTKAGVFIASAFCLTTTPLYAGNTWTGGSATTSNWSDTANWGGAAPAYGTITFSGSTRTTNTLDGNFTSGGSTSMNQLNVTSAGPWTLNNSNSAVLSLFDNGGTQAKVENNGAGLLTLNLPITFAANNASPPNPFGEINAVSGDMTFGTGTLTVNGSSVNGIKLFGSGHTLTFNNTVSASGKWFGITTSGTGNTINIGGTFTSGDIYVMNGGTVNITGTNTVTTSQIRLGGDFGNTGNQNQAVGGTLGFTNAAGGLTFASGINSVTGNTSNALLINSQNTSGTNTLSGLIAMDSNLTIQNSAGGTLNLTNATGPDAKGKILTFNNAGTMSVTGAIAGSTGGNVVKNGAGTLMLNAAGTYTGGTTINAGTLRINATNALPSTSGSLTITGGTFNMFASNQTVVGLSDGGGNTGGIITTTSGTAGTSTFTLNDTGSDSFAGQINDGATRLVALTKTGAGTLTLSNSNSFSGGTTLSGGTLTATNGGALGTGLITINGAGTTLNLRNDVNTSFSNNGLTLTTGATGTTTMSADQATGAGTNHTLTLGGTVSLASGTTLGITTGNGYTLAMGPVVVTGASTPSTSFAGAGTGVLASLTGSASATTSTVSFKGTGTTTITGNVLDGGGALSLARSTAVGTLILQGTGSNYTGSTSITNGTIRTAVATNGFGNTSGISIGAAGILDLRNDSSAAFSNGTTNYAVSTSGSGATINVDNNNSAVTGNTLTIGALNLGAHTLNISGANNYSLATGAVTLSGAGTVSANSANVTLGAVTNGGNRLTVTGVSNTTLAGGVSGAGDFLKQGTGTATFSGTASTFGGGGSNVFIDQGTVSVATGGSLGTTNGTTTGLINMGASGTGGLNATLNIANSGVTLANPVLVRYLQTGGKTISGTFTSLSSTYSGAISLADHLTITAANGGTLLFTGVISQAAGTGSATPGAGLVNNTSPTGGFSTNGPGVIINSGGSSTGIVEYDNAMTYVGDTVVNSGTLQFNGSGSLASSTIRLGNSGAATINMSAAGGTSLPVTINVRPSTGTKTISAANTSGTATLGGHFALDDDATVTETSSTGTLAITQGRASATDTLAGTDIKGHILTFNGAGNINVGATSPTGFGTIYNSTGNGNVVMSGSGTLSFTDKNTYSGTTTINSGTLNATAGSALGSTSSITVNSGGTLLHSGSSGVTDRINDAATMTLNGGTFNTGGLSEGTTGSAGVGALTLQNNSIIDLGSGASILHFAASNAATWTASKILEIDNWSGNPGIGGGTDQLLFGTTSSGLTAGQIAEIQFLNPSGFSAGTYGAAILANGEIVPIPESSTWVAGALAFIGLFATQRRRLARIMRAENRARTLPDNL